MRGERTSQLCALIGPCWPITLRFLGGCNFQNSLLADWREPRPVEINTGRCSTEFCSFPGASPGLGLCPWSFLFYIQSCCEVGAYELVLPSWMSGSVARGSVLERHFSLLLHAVFSSRGAPACLSRKLYFILLSVRSLRREPCEQLVGRGVCIREWDGKANETGSRRLLVGAFSAHAWIRVYLQNVFSQVKLCTINFIHSTYLSQRMLIEGCLLNYRLKAMKEDENTSFLPCYPILSPLAFFYPPPPIPSALACPLLSAMWLESQKISGRRNPRTVLLKLKCIQITWGYC